MYRMVSAPLTIVYLDGCPGITVVPMSPKREFSTFYVLNFRPIRDTCSVGVISGSRLKDNRTGQR